MKGLLCITQVNVFRNSNGIIGEREEMNAQTLPKVTMPNQANFIVVYPSRGK